MGRPICFLLIPLACWVSPCLYAQHGCSGGHNGGHFSSGGFSGHTVGHSTGQSLGHLFGHRSARDRSPFAKRFGSRGGELPPPAGAALNGGKVEMLPGPESSLAFEGQPRHPARGEFVAAFVPRPPFGANPPKVGFCDTFPFSWHRLWLPGDFDCFANPFFSHRLASVGFRGHFWSDLSLGGVGFGSSSESSESQAAPDSSDLAPRNAPSASPEDNAESGVPSAVQAKEPVTLLQLRDGSMYGLTRYWVAGDCLHYVTDYGGEGNVPLERVDFAKTRQLNASRGTSFILRGKKSNR